MVFAVKFMSFCNDFEIYWGQSEKTVAVSEIIYTRFCFIMNQNVMLLFKHRDTEFNCCATESGKHVAQILLLRKEEYP